MPPVYGGGGAGTGFANPMTMLNDVIAAGAGAVVSANNGGGANTLANATSPSGLLPSGNASRTWEFMIKYSSAAASGFVVMGVGNPGVSAEDFWYRPSDKLWQWRADTDTIANQSGNLPNDIFDGVGHLVQIAYAPTSLIIYVDGVAVQTKVTTGSVNTGLTPVVKLSEAIQLAGATEYLGQLENVAIYAGQLSATRCLAHWNARLDQSTYRVAVNADNPKVFWELNDTAGTICTDSQSNFNLVYNGAAVLGGTSIFAPGQTAGVAVRIGKGSPAGPFFAGSNPARVLGTPITNGGRKRTVRVTVDCTSAVVTGQAYAGFVTTFGGTALTKADVVGIAGGSANTAFRFSYSFDVDPAASYTITKDQGANGVVTLIDVEESDW